MAQLMTYIVQVVVIIGTGIYIYDWIHKKIIERRKNSVGDYLLRREL